MLEASRFTSIAIKSSSEQVRHTLQMKALAHFLVQPRSDRSDQPTLHNLIRLWPVQTAGKAVSLDETCARS